MSSVYLVRSGDEWLHVAGGFYAFRPSMTGATAYGDRLTADVMAGMLHGEPVEFREVAGDTAAGALAAAEAGAWSLREEVERLRRRLKAAEKQPLESTDG